MSGADETVMSTILWVRLLKEVKESDVGVEMVLVCPKKTDPL